MTKNLHCFFKNVQIRDASAEVGIYKRRLEKTQESDQEKKKNEKRKKFRTG